MSCLSHKTKTFFSEKLISFHFALVYEGGGDVYSLFIQVSKHEIYMLTKGQVTTKVLASCSYRWCCFCTCFIFFLLFIATTFFRYLDQLKGLLKTLSNKYYST